MEEVEIDVNDQDTILVLTMSLLAAYDPVIINFNTTATKTLTLDHVISHLLNKEVHR